MTHNASLPAHLEKTRWGSSFKSMAVTKDERRLEQIFGRRMMISALQFLLDDGQEADGAVVDEMLKNVGVANGDTNTLYEALAFFGGTDIFRTIDAELSRSGDRDSALHAVQSYIIPPFEQQFDDRRQRVFDLGLAGAARIVNELEHELPSRHRAQHIAAFVAALNGAQRDLAARLRGVEENEAVAADDIEEIVLAIQKRLLRAIDEYLGSVTAHFRDFLAGCESRFAQFGERIAALQREADQLEAKGRADAPAGDIVLGTVTLMESLFDNAGRDAAASALEVLRGVITRNYRRKLFTGVVNQGLDAAVERAWLQGCEGLVAPQVAASAATLMCMQYGTALERAVRDIARSLQLRRTPWSLRDRDVIVHGLVLIGPDEPDSVVRRLEHAVPESWVVLPEGNDGEVVFFLEEVGLQGGAVVGIAQAIEHFLNSGKPLLPVFDGMAILGRPDPVPVPVPVTRVAEIDDENPSTPVQ